MSEDLSFARSLALEAGKLLLDYYRKPDLQKKIKSDHSVVTEADLAADRLISQSIRQQYPNDFILSEELRTEYTATSSGSVWIVDPLDGTTNFSLRLHYWGVLLTRIADGQPELTVMYFPLLDELYSAHRGQGAFLNDRRIHVRPLDAEYPLPFFACCSRTFRRYEISVPYKVRTLGSAAYTFCALARAAAILGFEATPKIWDISGAWLLVREAGGVIDTLEGEVPFPLQHGVNYARQNFPTLGAATEESLAKAREQIKSRGGQMVQAG
jgi:myo-inositol-1(or 4)-monophosphatase